MNEKQLALLCLLIIFLGMALFVATYQNDFEEKKSYELKIEGRGKLFGRVEYVIRDNPSTLFVLNDGNTILVYYQKNIGIQKNDFVTIYGEKQLYNDTEELFAYKVIKE